jgi:putative SOS response-associated peptidase YedK
MPTRFSFHASNEKMKRQFQLQIKQPLQASYNIGMGDNAYIWNAQSTELEVVRWGFIPHWAKEETVGDNLITTRATGIATRLSFRMPIRQKRCIVFADSYYEWKKEGKDRKPYRIHLKNNELMAMAGVWETWEAPNGKQIKTFAIITTPANEAASTIGAAEMPAILMTAESRTLWLAEETPLRTALDLLQSVDSDMIDIYPIVEDVNDITNNYPDLHKPWVAPQA